ncbi:MAG: non-heme iron oxygenase ferredoxin subunit [Nocardiopsaceae bacterium]|jgi:nitrite reductase/ring-hydroxylating ferredoxin subunit|nr:non-heme iron oxygenase ferredoxin subunit [Nocardiopsaceae bacterium]
MTMDNPQQPAGAGPAEGGATWVRVARSGQVPEGYVRRFFADGVEVAVARFQGSVYATSNYCTHLDCLLSSGKLIDDGIQCSCHGSVFDLQSGEPIYPPATVPIETFPARESDAEIFVAITAADREHGGRRRSFRASDTRAPRRAP